MMRKMVFSVLVGLALMQPVGAADKEGRFAVMGVGASSCERYNQEREAKSKVYLVYAGWIDGYITADNQSSEDTFSFAPWQNTEMLAALLANHCKRNPKMPFVTALQLMVKAMEPMRLIESSVLLQMENDGKSIRTYREVLRRLQQSLTETGDYKGAVDGSYGDSTRKAIQAFQKRQGLEVNGLPDQLMMMNLFHKTKSGK